MIELRIVVDTIGKHTTVEMKACDFEGKEPSEETVSYAELGMMNEIRDAVVKRLDGKRGPKDGCIVTHDENVVEKRKAELWAENDASIPSA